MSDGSRTPSDSLVIACRHPDYLGTKFDFTEFSDGANSPPSGKGQKNWKGSYSGRPGLIEDLLPIIKSSYGGRSPNSVSDLKGALREFWRYLDAYEDWLQHQGQKLPRIDRLHQISGVIVEQFSQPGPEGRWSAEAGTRARMIRALILESVFHHGIPEITVAALANRRPSPKDTPSDEESLAIIRHLRSEVHHIFRRWQRADQMAREGRDLIDACNRPRGRLPPDFVVTEADAHTTIQQLIKRTGNPLPTTRDVLDALPLEYANRQGLPAWWPRYLQDQPLLGRKAGEVIGVHDCIASQYPTASDIATCALLCLARSAWNPSTILNLNADSWWSSYDQEHAWIFARKERSDGAFQYTVSAKVNPTGVFGVITRVLERNQPLRAWIANTSPDIASPELALRSVWLGVTKYTSERIFVADPWDARLLTNTLKDHIANYNEHRGTKVHVRDMTSSDFRDIGAAIMYKESRYSMWVLMLMLGHKHMSTTRIYGYRRASRQESHHLVASVVDDALSQAIESRSWDPALTRAKIEGIDVTPEARQRLDEYRKMRTYSGAICNDPFNPPTSIDPNNLHDGQTRCIQGHLCIARACPQRTVLNDSLSDICKVVAELEWRQVHTGAVRFSTGSEEQDLAYLRETLHQWPSTEVQEHLELWRGRIERGEHRPILFAGQH